MLAYIFSAIFAAIGAGLLWWETNWKIGVAAFSFFTAFWLTVYFRDDD